MADYTLSAKGTYDGSGFDSGIEDSKSKLNSFFGVAQSVASKVESAAKGVVGVIGGIGGAIGSLAAQGGMARALNLEQAKTMFAGLKLNWDDYYDSIDRAVTGTAFALDSAALVAANLAASGVAAGADMDNALRGAVGTAATFGAELGDIGSIYSKVAAQGKVSGETLQQLSDRGINAVATLSTYLGKSQEEVKKMVSAGKVDFKTFSDAMNAAFGDSAQAANQTFTGSMANMRAALSRIGAKFADPIRANAIPVFNAVREALNSVSICVDPLVSRFESLANAVSSLLSSRIKTFAEDLKESGSFMVALEMNLGSAGAKIAAVVGAIGGLGVAIGALSSVLGAIPGLGGIVGMLTGGAGAAGAFGVALDALKGVVGSIGGTFGTFSAIMAEAGGGLGGFKVALGAVMTPMSLILVAVVALAAAFAYLMATNEEFRNTVMSCASQIAAALLPVLQSLASNVIPALMSIIQALMPLFQTVLTTIFSLAAALAPIASTILTTIIPVVGQVLGLLAQVVSSVVSAVVPVIQLITDMILQNMPLIQQIVTTAMTVIGAIVQTVWPLIESIITGAMSVIQAIINVVMAVISGDWGAAWMAIQELVQTVLGVIGNIIGTAVGTIIGIIASLVSNVIGFFSDLWSSVTSKVSSMWSNVGSAFRSGVTTAINFVRTIPQQIMGIFSNAKSLLFNSGKALIDGLVSGIKSAIGGAVDAVGGALSAIRDLFPFSPAKKGPFSGRGWVLYSGMSIMDALGEGATKQSASAVRAYSEAVNKVRSSLSPDGFVVNGSISAFDDPTSVACITGQGTKTDERATSELKDELEAFHKDLPKMLEAYMPKEVGLLIDNKRGLARLVMEGVDRL